MRNLKFISKFLAFLLIFSLLLPAGMAQAEEANGEGDEDRETGTLTIHKFEREPGVKDGEEGDGTEGQKENVPGDAKPLAGVEFTITMTGKYDPDTDEWTDISNGDSFRRVTDSDGIAEFTNLALGRYKVEETDAPDHVNMNKKTFYVDIPMTGLDGKGLNYDVHIYPKNETIRGAVELIKVDGKTKEPLAGVTFELYDEDGREGEYITDSDGAIRVSGLAYGNYYFQEIATLDGYVLGNQSIEFSITESGTVAENGERTGEVVELEAFNYVEPEIDKDVDEDAVNRGETVTYTLTIDLPGDIESYKSFIVTDELDNRLSYVDGSQSVSVPGAFDFDADGQTLTWTVTDSTALAGIDQVTISFDAQVAEDAEPNVEIDNQAKIDFENQHGNDGEKKSNTVPLTPTAGDVIIEKVDGDDHRRKLDGAVFQLRDKDGNVVETEKTGLDGRIIFKDLDYGEYELVEIVAPLDYNLLKNPIKIVVNEDYEGYVHVVKNYKKGWHLPRTGGIGTIPFTILGLMIMGSAVYLYVRRRNQAA